jgi:hypothetical protein
MRVRGSDTAVFRSGLPQAAGRPQASQAGAGAEQAECDTSDHGKPQLGWTQADRSSDSVKEACHLKDRNNGSQEGSAG